MKLRYFFILPLFFFSSVEAKRVKEEGILPAPIGEYGVGYKTQDYTKPNGRSLKVSIFHPVETRGQTSPLPKEEFLTWICEYENLVVNAGAQFLNHYILPTSWQIPSEKMDAFKTKLRALKTHHISGQATEGFFPVLYFLPDYGMNPSSYLTLLHSIASRGYVVIATQHPGISACVTFEEKPPLYEENLPAPRQLMSDDVDFLMAEVEKDARLSPFCDFEKTAIMGHGWGSVVLQGSNSAEMKKVNAKILLEEHTKNYKIDEEPTPTYYIFSSTVDKSHVAGVREAVGEENLTYLRIIDNFSYHSFTDMPFIINLLGLEKNDNIEAFEKTYLDFTAGICTFLDIHVKGNEGLIPVS